MIITRYLLIILFINFNIIAQEDCPMNILSSEVNAFSGHDIFNESFDIVSIPKDIITLKLKPHIIRRSNGSGGLSVDQLNTAILHLNNTYSEINLFFEACSINYIDDDENFKFLDFSRSKNSEEFKMAISNRVDDAINIFFLPNISYCGWSSFPSYKELYDKDWTVMKNNCATNGSTLSHEIGHYLDLYHTHSTMFGKENVDRSGTCTNCNTTGDKICDTPADPGLRNNVSSSCKYIGNQLDSCDKAYEPDTENLMSYSKQLCRRKFSKDQISRMLQALAINRSNISSSCKECLDDIIVEKDVSLKISQTRAASETLIASNLISNGAEIKYSAGKQILLKEGFSVKKGSQFHGTIEDCSEINLLSNILISSKKVSKKVLQDENNSLLNELLNLKIFPNPTNKYINISSKKIIFSWELMNLNGKLLNNEKINNEYSELKINLESLESDLYILKVIFNDGSFSINKVIKK